MVLFPWLISYHLISLFWNILCCNKDIAEFNRQSVICFSNWGGGLLAMTESKDVRLRSCIVINVMSILFNDVNLQITCPSCKPLPLNCWLFLSRTAPSSWRHPTQPQIRVTASRPTLCNQVQYSSVSPRAWSLRFVSSCPWLSNKTRKKYWE